MMLASISNADALSNAGSAACQRKCARVMFIKVGRWVKSDPANVQIALYLDNRGFRMKLSVLCVQHLWERVKMYVAISK